MNGGNRPERAPWGDFPPVIRNGDLKELEREPEYHDAKSGDRMAALAMAERLVRPETVEALRSMVGGKPAKIVPVLAQEEAGNNKIPLMTAEVLGDRLGLEVEYNIVQAEKVGRTGKGADHRLAMNPPFKGEVEQGRPYILVDDSLSMGGTIASLRGHIENRGGEVLGATVMTAYPSAVHLPVQQKMLDRIEKKHGQAMNDYWKEEFGYGIDQLTQGEVGHLRKASSVDAIRDRIAAARDAAGWAVGEGRTGETSADEGRRVRPGPFKDKADAFRQLPAKDLLKQYPDDQAVKEATAVQAVAGKVAQEHIQDDKDRNRFLQGVRDRIADNLEHGRKNTAPRVLEDRSQGKDDQER